ncbi:hypothetical protein HZQ28_18035 [Elizabethkingia anophelis]|uniref:hypothetical protein n=1 Tax=Elizabethkingia meningoseptica TaxID=238 RepID=UPI0016287C8B|nr:hypothetical protein [Elizabethkingia meningoseptica]MCT3649877.1 hypothetical protein [Elizabethkingia anophelis]MCT3697056.1 hypothetical protein [Elizabethkingia anophelis]MCT3861011.1 hypothetical protein [Elizabethkingia anophelis]MCT3946800.1 hypothetical protein [Elizabethkingia anophelis]MCT3996388.1 hypothetical protein [Elizabethkingia anophelis]
MSDNNKKISYGMDFYAVLKKYNKTLWAVVIIGVVVIFASAYQVISVYQMSSNNIYGISESGNMVPLKKLENEEGKRIQAKADIEYFVSQYYDLDSYSMKRKRERVYWLVGEQPTKVIKDRASKGYFDLFMTMQGLKQSAYILQNTLLLSNQPPYNASFVVRITRVNGDQEEYYNAKVNMTLVETNRNYPYNPYGFLITNFTEDLEKIAKTDKIDEELKNDVNTSNEAINQNPKENGQ